MHRSEDSKERDVAKWKSLSESNLTFFTHSAPALGAIERERPRDEGERQGSQKLSRPCCRNRKWKA